MSKLREMMADALSELSTETCIFQLGPEARELSCAPSNVERGLRVTIGGLEVVVRAGLLIKRTSLADVTTIEGRSVQFRGKNYRVASCTEDSARAYYRLGLVDAHSGR